MDTQYFEGRPLTITGRILRTATVRDEPYECLVQPEGFVSRLKKAGFKADLFSFMQEICDRTPRYPFHLEWESLAVVPITTYETWLKKQINDKTRNLVRKAQKNGVEIRRTDLTDEFVRGVVEIYNETPVRQGKPFKHFGKDFETIKRELSTFPDRSDFLGAFWNGELIGFVKVVWGRDVASLMHILSKIGRRDKAPTNGLVGRAVEVCAERKIPALHYSVWSKGGLGDFKRHHGFIRHETPRYFVPLNLRGEVMLKLKLHRKLVDVIPEGWADQLILLRNKFSYLRHPAKTVPGQ